MAIQFATYNDEMMEAGKFYLLHVNKDNASALVEVSNRDTVIEFESVRHLDITYPTQHIPYVQVWEKIGESTFKNITQNVSINTNTISRTLSIESERDITGFIVLM